MTKRTDQDTAGNDGRQIAKQVVDAWAEAGKRMKQHEPDSADEDDLSQ